MPDVEWLKALATAEAVGGELRPREPEATRLLARARIDEALVALRQEAEEAAEVYGAHAHSSRAVRVLPLGEAQGGGFVLLCGRAQLTLTRDGAGPGLLATLAVLQGFDRKVTLVRRFAPHADQFGSVVWMLDNSLLMNHELIMKRLLEDLTRAGA